MSKTFHAVIIDDNPWAIADMRQTFDFERWSFRVTGEFKSAESALPFILKTQPDLIMTDIRMEKMSGLDLSKFLRDKGIISLIVLISSYEQFNYAQLALRYDIFDYILKPLDDAVAKELMLRIQKRLGIQSLHPGMAARNNTLDAAMAYIEQNYMLDVSLNDVAEQIFINKNYLSELFSKKIGITFSQYKNCVRIRNACKLMDQGHQNLSEIAIAVGFDNSSRFSKVFRQYMGKTPQESRHGSVFGHQ